LKFVRRSSTGIITAGSIVLSQRHDYPLEHAPAPASK
jgi:hypothetical protein